MVVSKSIVAEEGENNQDEKMKCTDLAYLNRRTKSNPDLMVEIISLYLKQTPPLIQGMKQSFQDQDWPLLYATVHKMIPSFSIMGINTDFSYMAKDILKYTRAELKEDDITESIERIENICLQACEELEEEVNKIKVDKA